MNYTLLILGAKSDIGIATAIYFASRGYSLQLAARQHESLEAIASQIKEQYSVQVDIYEFDALDFYSHSDFISNLTVFPDIVLCAVGYLGNQKKSQENIKELILALETNFLGPVNILSLFANFFEKLGTGTIVGISSVAGEKGKMSNYLYGAAKSGLTTFLSGLRNRLNLNGIRVITVIPGPVNTKMTKNIKLLNFLTAEVDDVARSIYRAVKKNKDVIYVKPIWKYIMFIIRLIPVSIIKRIKLWKFIF